jgi:hypothetical protein
MIPKPLISDVFDFCSVFKFPRPNDNFECRGPPETTWTGTRNAPKQHNLQNHPKPVQKRSKNGPLPSGCGIAKRAPLLEWGGGGTPLSHGHRETLREEVGLLAAVCPP